MSACEAECGRDAKEGRRTCGAVPCAMKIAAAVMSGEASARVVCESPADETPEGSRYDDLTEGLFEQLDARAMFVVVLDGVRGSDFSLQVRAGKTEAELWTRRLLGQVRRVAARCERALDGPYSVPNDVTEFDLVPQSEANTPAAEQR